MFCAYVAAYQDLKHQDTPGSALLLQSGTITEMQRSSLQARAFGAGKAHPALARAPVAARRATRSQVQVQAFFNFLGGAKPGAAVSPKAKELSEALIDIVSQTKPGSAVSPVVKAEIEELVSLLWSQGEILCVTRLSLFGALA